MKHAAVYITTKTEKEARKLARMLLENRLIACANIVPKIESVYWWKGKIDAHKESLIIGKTRMELSGEITEFVRKNHSYAAPCVNFLPISKGNPDYLKWLDKETKRVK